MQRVATFTKIHGNGNIEAVMNGIVNAELMRQRELEREELEKERDFANMIRARRNNLLKEKYIAIKAESHNGFCKRIKEDVIFVFGCIICWGEELGLWKYIYNGGNGNGN